MQLADLLNFSFVIGVFPLILKTAKIVPVFKKDSKLDYSNYRPISLFSITYNLASGSIILHHMP